MDDTTAIAIIIAAPLKGRAFKIEISKVSGSAIAAEICAAPHNRLLRRSIVAHFARKVRATNTQRTWLTPLKGRVFKIS